MATLEEKCTKCKQPKTLDQFGVSQRGILRKCLPCSKADAISAAAKRKATRDATLEDNINAAIASLQPLHDYLSDLEACIDTKTHTLRQHSNEDALLRLPISANEEDNLFIDKDVPLNSHEFYKTWADHVAVKIWLATGYRWT